MSTETIKQLVKIEVDKLIVQAKLSLKEARSIALTQAWRMLQIAVAAVVQIIENIAINLAGQDKKTIALESLSSFYDKVFIVIDVPFVPKILEPIIHKYMKTFLMMLVGATIDAMVTTFRNTGVFIDRSVETNAFIEIKPKISEEK